MSEQANRTCSHNAPNPPMAGWISFALILLLVIGATSVSAETADFFAIAGSATSAVAAGNGGALYYATSLHITYQPSQLSGVTDDLLGVAHNGTGTYFAVGGNGTVLRSNNVNGSSFIPETSIPTTATLYGVARWPSAMIALGAGGVIIRSSSLSGGGWTADANGVDADLHDLVAGLTVGVAVGDNGTILWSNVSGNSWTPLSSYPVPASHLHGVALLADNRFIAVGSDGTALIGTANGQDWEELSFPDDVDLNDVAVKAASPSRIVAIGAGGRIYYSSNNGADWTLASSPVDRDLRGVVYTGTDWLIAGDHGTLVRSTDGITWTDHTAVAAPSWGDLKKKYR